MSAKDLLTPFSNAASQTFKLLLDLDVSTDVSQPIESSEEAKEKVDIVIEITGDLAGEVMYSFPKDTTLEMVKMMSGMEFNEIDEFVKSALGEIANIISGNAMTGLSQSQVICDIRPPKILEGGALPTKEGCPIYRTKVKTSIGDVELNFRTV
ncbi:MULTISPECIES: chemotaxis protein CheX [Desulfitobacterium]|uniref:Putative inhibitor of MCP methylation, CheC n=1 Tax=Desulfitobacterium dehalogenans (strain ATCC 51507 / DSM 9161 / JW/IU-DC1) TaxID=756499 RepID=I4A8A7_DESDJ|nr:MULTISPECIES: chemotaxis protein CheX [Desulfitobacterium]AFM00192.1 putative inhibitor of MCP methylation, CheC [Desulfitobacterium dehalogenans ATCC 51507]